MMLWDAVDLLAGVWLGWYLHTRYYQPVLPIKVTTLPTDMEPYRKWSECVAPIASKMTLAGKLGLRYTFNPEGALALGKFMSDMGVALDTAVGMRRADPPKKEDEKLADALTTTR